MAHLKRSITLPFLTCYGLGTILGAGIYVLIGKVAGIAGMQTPWAFGLAALIATFTAISYGELASLFPKSAGEAVYVHEAFGFDWLSKLVGWLIILTGVVSAATIANGFVGYLDLFVRIEPWVAITCLVIGLGILAIWGIQESIAVATVITIIEVAGLAMVLWYAGGSLGSLPERASELVPGDFSSATGIALGGFLAFYAYIGFEDMVNIAEEVVDPRQSIRRAILWALGLSTFLYMLIALVAVLAIPIEELSDSGAPLALLVERNGGSTWVIGAVSLFAVVNGALVQMIMASRVAYGMANQGLAHPHLGWIYWRTQTPIVATLLVTIIVLVFALTFPLVTLAKITSFIILSVFALVNLSLIRLRPTIWTSYIGFLLCIGLLGVSLIG